MPSIVVELTRQRMRGLDREHRDRYMVSIMTEAKADRPRRRVASITPEDEDGLGLRRRCVESLTPEDDGKTGRPAWYAYGQNWIAARARCDIQAVRDAIRDKRLDPTDPIDVVRWIAHRLGFAELAADLESL
jgi:hypothetical protein